MKHPFITVIGNVATGKSTITHFLAQKLNSHEVKADELYKTNPFFKDAVVDRTRWSLASDTWFLVKRVEFALQIKEKLKNKGVVQDSGLLMSWVYANSILKSGHMNQRETNIYNQLYDLPTMSTPKENLVIYLHNPISTLLTRIKHRGREFEIKHHSKKYLKSIQNSLKKLLMTLKKTKLQYFVS